MTRVLIARAKNLFYWIGAFFCYLLGSLLVIGVVLGERQYLIGIPGFFALGIILDRMQRSEVNKT